MRTPRDWSGEDLIKRLAQVGYEVTRQKGSHVRLTRREPGRTHHVTIPLHSSAIRVGTLNAILESGHAPRHSARCRWRVGNEQRRTASKTDLKLNVLTENDQPTP